MAVINSTPTSSKTSRMTMPRNNIKYKTYNYIPWSYTVPNKVTTNLKLASERTFFDATSIGDYALFGGGSLFLDNSDITNMMDTYNSSLLHFTTSTLTTSKNYLTAGRLGDSYAIFAGGEYINDNYDTFVANDLDAFNPSLVHITPPTLLQARKDFMSVNVGDYLVFGGGYINDSTVINSAEAYNSSLIRTSISSLNTARGYGAGVSIGTWGLICGGIAKNPNTYYTNLVDAYNTSLVKTIPTALGLAKCRLAGAEIEGYYAVIAGGVSNGNDDSSNSVDCYNTSLTRSNVTMSNAKDSLAGIGIKNKYALFAGGWSGNVYTNVVDCFNTSLIRAGLPTLSVPKIGLKSATAGDYMIIAGGEFEGDSETSLLDIYGI